MTHKEKITHATDLIFWESQLGRMGPEAEDLVRGRVESQRAILAGEEDGHEAIAQARERVTAHAQEENNHPAVVEARARQAEEDATRGVLTPVVSLELVSEKTIIESIAA